METDRRWRCQRLLVVVARIRITAVLITINLGVAMAIARGP
jgi:hypothetical protein